MKDINLENVILQTDRLMLRVFSEHDLSDLFEIVSDKGVPEMAGIKSHECLEDTRRLLNEFIKRKSVFAIVLLATQKVIGFVGFYEDTRIRDDDNYSGLKAVEIDYLVSRNLWGKGIAAEAVNKIAKYCFNDLKIDAIIATHAIGNVQSKRVIEKCGFRFIKPAVFYNEAFKICIEGAMYILFNNTDSIR